RLGFGPIAPGERLEDHALGLIDDLPYLKNQERVIFARAGITQPLSLAEYEAHGGLAGLRAATAMDPEAICQTVLDSGLRGRGGAGFPAGIKWNTVRQQVAAQSGPKFICCNADEGDSGTFADRMVMEGDPFLLIEGMAIAARATGAAQGYIYIRSEYPTAIARMRAAIAIMAEAGWLDGFDLQVRRGAGAYICGEESSMLESLEGRRGTVRAKPPIPAISGLHGRPTLVNNVLTLASVPTILARGAAFYRDYGLGKSTGTQPFQLAGNIARGGLVEKAFGVSLRDLIEGFGGGTATGRPLRAVQLGGPLGAYVSAAMLDTPMTYEDLAEAGAMLGHGGIVVFDDTVDMARMARFAFEFCEIESCGKCTPCRLGAIRGKETVEKILRGEDVARNIALIEDLAEVMRDGSLCAMGGLTPMPVMSAIRLFPEDFDRAPRVAAE
ncbi:MAG: NADH-ubiquinone oxidoreductase-F iron-sulfur binding region domain-containing protein, partial [Pseudomonadota bacterium]